MDLMSILTEVDFDLKIREVIDLWITGQWRLERKRAKECVTYRMFTLRRRYYDVNYSVSILKLFLINNFIHSLSEDDNKIIFDKAFDYLKIIYKKDILSISLTDDILLGLFQLYCYSVSNLLKNAIHCLNDNDCKYLFSELTVGRNEEINNAVKLKFNCDIKNHYLNENYTYELGADLINNLDLRCNKLKFSDLIEEDDNEDDSQCEINLYFDNFE